MPNENINLRRSVKVASAGNHVFTFKLKIGARVSRLILEHNPILSSDGEYVVFQAADGYEPNGITGPGVFIWDEFIYALTTSGATITTLRKEYYIAWKSIEKNLQVKYVNSSGADVSVAVTIVYKNPPKNKK